VRLRGVQSRQRQPIEERARHEHDGPSPQAHGVNLPTGGAMVESPSILQDAAPRLRY
jgi:hypothetical protein